MKNFKIKAVAEDAKKGIGAALEIYDFAGNYLGSIDMEGDIIMNRPELISLKLMADFSEIFKHFETFFNSLMEPQNEIEQLKLSNIPTIIRQ